MSQINITLPDGSVKSFDHEPTTQEVAESIGKSLAKAGLAGKFKGDLVDYQTPLTEDGDLEIVTDKHEDALSILRHSAAHLMAQAIKRLYPEAKFGVGPAIDSGFYYDTDTDQPLTEEDLGRVEKEMKKIVKENLPIVRKEISRQ